MSTRSSTRNLFPPLEDPERTIRRGTRVDPNLLNNFKEINMATNEAGDDGPPPTGGGGLPVPDLRTMEELCQPTLNGQGGPIAPINIQATNFGLKNDMIQQVQNSCQFHGLPGDDANKHLDKFLHVTQSIKVNGVTDDALRLYLFPHSLTHHATAWFDRLPRNSITTFEQMAKMFLEKYFPPSMVTKLRNEITNFRQRPDESLFHEVTLLEQAWIGSKAKKSVKLLMEKLFGIELELMLIDSKKIIIFEASVSRYLKLENEEGIDYLPNSTIFEQLALMGFETMARNLDNLSSKFLMYPRLGVHKELGDSLVRVATTASSLEAKQDSGAKNMGDTIAQHWVENVLKRRVKKLEQKKRSRTHGLKRLRKVDATTKVESSGDEESLDEDASKQGRRINAIDADEDITLVSIQDDAGKEMFDVDALNDEEVFAARQNENVVEEVVDAAQVSTAATTVTITTEDITLAQALEALKTSKPKVKGIIFQEPEPMKPMKKKVQIMLDEEVALKLQAEFDEEERLAREKAKKEKEANIALIENG
ncbi:reverse transcriptase domain-containing protein [Tanacetum coccineum]